MISVKFFPTILIALSVASSVPYAYNGNWRLAIYWVAAATLSASITY